MLVLLHPDQAHEVSLIAEDLGITPEEATRLLLSGPLSLHTMEIADLL